VAAVNPHVDREVETVPKPVVFGIFAPCRARDA
jgi:hypothetical protein